MLTGTTAEALPERFGKYRVERRIAVGGMAEVFLATTDPPVVLRVAVKRIKPAYAADPGFRTMFLDEARVAGSFDHPNVIRVLDYEGGEVPYLVMELVDGPDLRTLIYQSSVAQTWVPFDHAAAIIAAAAHGLHYAHTYADPEGRPLHVVHRDMSPQNVMLTKSGGVKVVDFGIARAAGRNTRTQAGIIKGKYAYMSPEQVRGETLDARTDIFALGILLYELLTYRNPFRRDRDEGTLVAVTDETPASPTKLRPEVPADLAAIVMQALAKDREARPQTARALAEALESSIATRRRAVTAAHLADLVAGLESQAAARPPAPDADHEVSEASIRHYAFDEARTDPGALPGAVQRFVEAPTQIGSMEDDRTQIAGGTDASAPPAEAAMHEASTRIAASVDMPAVTATPEPAAQQAPNAPAATGGTTPGIPAAGPATPDVPAGQKTAGRLAGWRTPILIVLGLALLGAVVGIGVGLLAG